MLQRLRRDEAGFGMVELVVAISLLNVALLALVAALNSGAMAVGRASRVTTATSIADSQMELFRGLTYNAIRLDDTTLAADDNDALYTADPAYNVAMEIDTTVPNDTCANPVPFECDAVRTVNGPDGRQYRVDTYIRSVTPAPTARNVKSVTVVVRDNANPNTTYVRQRTDFDASTGTASG